MNTYHIHINGLVQGVGFRPFVCRLAKEFDICGSVSNTNNGVHIEINASKEVAEDFYLKIILHPLFRSCKTPMKISLIFY